ncbi:MAG TPA: hypothetical protein VFH73_17070 [Polyangia bacterium]|nr:hypothetical protein [Polyangia bacterium]
MALAVALAAAAPAALARADDNLLRGPHPFLKENELSAHLLVASGVGDSSAATKLGLDYGYRFGGPNWLNLQLNMQFARCPQPCSTGKAFETIAGGKWKFATGIPVVPYGKAGAGLIFVFPGTAQSAVGFAARVGGGASYFLYDWLGLGVEANLSLGRVSYQAGVTTDPGYTIFDLGGGVELQF